MAFLNRVADCRHCGTRVSFGGDGRCPACGRDSREEPDAGAGARIEANRLEDIKRASWTAHRAQSLKGERKAGQRRLGAVLIVLGVVLSAVTIASAGPGGGGRFFYGLIVAGVIQLARGMT